MMIDKWPRHWAEKVLTSYRDCLASAGWQFRGGNSPTSGIVSMLSMQEFCGSLDVYAPTQPLPIPAFLDT